MISWKQLVENIEKLEELPNGKGTEIEFSYKGVEYGIVSYGSSCDIMKCSDVYYDGIHALYSEEIAYSYSTLTELGRATDIGFSVEEAWDLFEDISVKPDFENYTLEEVLRSYVEALKS